VDNLWSLGGEIIRDLHHDPSLRKRTAERLPREAVHQYGGPLVHNGAEDQQRSFDATCRRSIASSIKRGAEPGYARISQTRQLGR